MKKNPKFEEVFLTDQEFASLLGLSVVEFQSLDRSDLHAYIVGNHIEEYFIYIHPSSPAAVLAKLKIEQHNFLRFNYEKLHAIFELRKSDKRSDIVLV